MEPSQIPDQQTGSAEDLRAYFAQIVHAMDSHPGASRNQRNVPRIHIVPFEEHRMFPLFPEENGRLFHVCVCTTPEDEAWYVFFRDRVEKRSPYFYDRDQIESFATWDVAIRSFFETVMNSFGSILVRGNAHEKTLTFYLPTATTETPLLT